MATSLLFRHQPFCKMNTVCRSENSNYKSIQTGLIQKGLMQKGLIQQNLIQKGLIQKRPMIPSRKVPF